MRSSIWDGELCYFAPVVIWAIVPNGDSLQDSLLSFLQGRCSKYIENDVLAVSFTIFLF